MSENKQNEVLTGYEQLKRRNRRRLVTASCLVAASCILLAAALSSGPAENDPAKQTAEETSSVENKAAGAAQAPALKSAAQNGETAADKPQDLAGEDKPSAADSEISEPENVGAPLVLINDRLEDSNIKGLEASEKLQQAETAQTAPKQAKQRAAEKVPATADSTDTVAVEKPKRTAETKPQKAERTAKAKPKAKETKTAEKVADKPKTAAEKTKPDTAKSDSAVKEVKKADKAESKKTAEKDRSDGKKHETAQKTDKADKTKTAEKEKSGKKAAIQAGYAEKERALSLQRKMKAAGIDSTITEIMTDNGKVYRVKSSNYKNARDAERDLNKLRVHGIAGQVTNE
ncbi:cell division protein FtsN [Neisseria meningitidis]|uniref:cell division protein FtsN n=1 Tax=Neisseria meningitidis TaxID=487 RepID=UPI001C5BD828|nr:cell division protein FtsN [Neisseria meningitidis]MBW3991571.1 cell division protein FtsN [Neisseria meningitidis]MCG3352344.1 cell division protein FtsN [Neisseria meningitidis]MCG3355501.1 cell division protein FtsN [Neisseria meningitidis]MCG3364640.1 cell division protein FtsN [Neisseria meningitidis]MCG3366806.1 cell division protein FtsN [Neisseria meningitidis]